MNAKPKVVAVLQARLGSTRLPNKVLADLQGRPMLERIIRRVGPARLFDFLVVATTDKLADDPIVALAAKLGVPCFRGSEEDCLDRYYRCAKAFGADIVVRLTGDNPLVDASFCDWVVQPLLTAQPRWDYVAADGRSFPVGLSVEAFTFAALAAAWEEASAPRFREHVTLYFYDSPTKFRVLELAGEGNYSSMRWTVDSPEDLAFARAVYHHFGHDGFSWHDVIALLERHPEWQQINSAVKQKVV